MPWQRALDVDPHNAPGQGEVVQLLSQLYQSGLLRSDQVADIDALEHAQKNRGSPEAQTAPFEFHVPEDPAVQSRPTAPAHATLVCLAFHSVRGTPLACRISMGLSGIDRELVRLC